MQIGNMAERLMSSSHVVVGVDPTSAAITRVAAAGTVRRRLAPSVIGSSLRVGIESSDDVEFVDQLLTSMRKGFGEPAITTKEPKQ